MTEYDTGARCERHVGEVFPPRCDDCAAEATHSGSTLPRPNWKTYVPGSECPLHRGYPMPCDRCEREGGRQLPIPIEQGVHQTDTPRGVDTSHSLDDLSAPPNHPDHVADAGKVIEHHAGDATDLIELDLFTDQEER